MPADKDEGGAAGPIGGGAEEGDRRAGVRGRRGMAAAARPPSRCSVLAPHASEVVDSYAQGDP